MCWKENWNWTSQYLDNTLCCIIESSITSTESSTSTKCYILLYSLGWGKAPLLGMLSNAVFLSGKNGSVSYYMTSWQAFQPPLDGPGWASESPDGLGPLCTKQVGSMGGPLYCVLSKHRFYNYFGFNWWGGCPNLSFHQNCHDVGRGQLSRSFLGFRSTPTAKTAWLWCLFTW